MGRGRQIETRQRGARARERGAALTEFAIVAPLFVAMIYGSLYLTELGVFRLKTQEVARYSAWAFTTRPLSNYGAERINAGAHRDLMSDAQDSVGEEVLEVYADLDGVNHRAAPRAWGKTMSAQYQQRPNDFRVLDTQVIPEGINPTLADPFSRLGWILSALGIGADVNSLVNGPFTRLGFNVRSQVTARANVEILLPLRPKDAIAGAAMARHGGVRGADLTQWQPSNRSIRDNNQPLSTTLVADSWRVTQGWSATPKWLQQRDRTHYSNVVANLCNGKSLKAFPGGVLANIASILDYIPRKVGAYVGLPDPDPKTHIFSRPYTSAEYRNPRPPETSEAPLAAGQVDIFAELGVSPESGNAVRKFETMPMYSDPVRPGDSEYLKSLKERGNNFMGCRDEEKRGCWEQ